MKTRDVIEQVALIVGLFVFSYFAVTVYHAAKVAWRMVLQ